MNLVSPFSLSLNVAMWKIGAYHGYGSAWIIILVCSSVSIVAGVIWSSDTANMGSRDSHVARFMARADVSRLPQLIRSRLWWLL